MRELRRTQPDVDATTGNNYRSLKVTKPCLVASPPKHPVAWVSTSLFSSPPTAILPRPPVSPSPPDPFPLSSLSWVSFCCSSCLAQHATESADPLPFLGIGFRPFPAPAFPEPRVLVCDSLRRHYALSTEEYPHHFWSSQNHTHAQACGVWRRR